MNTLSSLQSGSAPTIRGQHLLASSPFLTLPLLIFYAFHSFMGLTYEVVWIKYLTGTLGMTLPAFAVVLSTFMAGMGLGSFGLTYISKRLAPYSFNNIKSSLLVFATLQAIIGILGMGFPFFLSGMDSIYTASAPETENFHHLLIRCLFTGILLLPITSLLGTGFPLMAGLSVKFVSATSEQRPGLVYYIGLLASALGALSALVMIPTWGLFFTSLFLGTLNLLTAIAATGLSALPIAWDKNLPAKPTSSSSKHGKNPSRKSKGSDLADNYQISLILGTSAMIGFLVLGLEIIGAQYLWLVVNATAYSEGLLFAAILLGMGVGSTIYLLTRPRLSPRTLLMFGFLSAVCAQMFLISFSGSIASLFDQFLHQSGGVQAWIGTSSIRFFLASGILTFGILAFPAMGYGLSFCCLCELIIRGQTHSHFENVKSHDSENLSCSVSPIAQLYAWHNFGSVAGVLLTSFVLIPWIGLTMSLTLLSVLGLMVFGAMFSLRTLDSVLPEPRSHRQLSRFRLHPTPVMVTLLGFVLWIGLNGDLTFQTRAVGATQEILFQQGDASGVVEVFADRQTGEKTLYTSRLRQEGGSRTEDLRVQRLQGYLPILLHPDPKHALVVGLGTGIAASSYLREEVEHVTIVEISKGIIEAASFFDKESHGILSHPKTRIVRQDGRNFVKLTRQRFDLIVQELFFPYQSGVGSLYTVEHYQRIRERLAPGGMVGQWITINQLGLEDLRVLIHTFQNVFPHTSLWLHGGYLLLLGTLEPLSIDFSNFSYRFYQNDALGGVASLGTDPYDILSRFVTQGSALHDWVSDVSINTDDNRLIEYSAPLSFAKLNTTDLAADTLEAFLPLLRPLTDIVQTQHASTDFDPGKLEHVSQASSLLLQGIIARTREQHEQAESLYAQALVHNPTSYQVKTFLEPLWSSRGRSLLLKDEYEEASRWLHKAFEVNENNPDVLFDLGLLASQEGDDLEASQFYQQILDEFPNWPQRLTTTFNLGLSYYRMENYTQAVRLFQAVAQLEPASVNAHFNLANSLAQTGDYDQAVIHYRTVLRLAPDHKQAQANYVEILEWVKAQEIDAS